MQIQFHQFNSFLQTPVSLSHREVLYIIMILKSSPLPSCYWGSGTVLWVIPASHYPAITNDNSLQIYGAHLYRQGSATMRWKDQCTSGRTIFSGSKTDVLKPPWYWHVCYKDCVALIVTTCFSHLPHRADSLCKGRRVETALPKVAQQGKEWLLARQSHMVAGAITKLVCLKWPLQSCHLSTLLAERVNGQWQAVRQDSKEED